MIKIIVDYKEVKVDLELETQDVALLTNNATFTSIIQSIMNMSVLYLQHQEDKKAKIQADAVSEWKAYLEKKNRGKEKMTEGEKR
jgi:hypothetical protein